MLIVPEMNIVARYVCQTLATAAMTAIINEVPINYVEAGNPDAMPVVFLHGFPFNLAMWNPQLEVVRREFRAIAYDIRGHGESYVGDGQFTIEGHVDDLMAVLDFLKIQKATVVGLSMGGYIMLRALERNPDRFKAAILCDTRSEPDSNEAKLRRFEGMKSVKKSGSGAFAEAFVKAVFAPETFASKPDIIDAIRKTISRTTPLSIAGTLLALASRTDTTSSLSSIRIPTLILVGEQDVTTPPSAARSMHDKISGSEFHIVPHAAHMSNLENHEFFNDKLLSFLRRIAQ